MVWLRPSSRGPIVVPFGSMSAMLPPVKGKPPLNVPM